MENLEEATHVTEEVGHAVLCLDMYLHFLTNEVERTPKLSNCLSFEVLTTVSADLQVLFYRSTNPNGV